MQPLASTSRPFAVPAYLILVALGSMRWLGYGFGGSNQSIQVPILRHYADPSLYRGDLLMTTVDGYASYFFPALGRVVRWFGHLELLYFLLFFASHLLALWAIFALGRLVFDRSSSAAMACVLYLARVQSLGAEFSYWGRLTHAHVATGVLLWAVYLFLRGREGAAWAVAGVAFDIHALYALHVAALFGLSSALRARQVGVATLSKHIALFALLSAPTWIWLARAASANVPSSMALWLEIMRERSALHTFPLSTPPAIYGRYLLLIAFSALAFAQGRGAPRARQIAMHFFAGVALLCLAGLAFSEWSPVRLVIQAQLLRSTRWLTFVMLLWAADLLATSWTRGGASRTASCLCFLGVFVQQPGLLALGVVLYAVLEWELWPAWAPVAAVLGVAGAAALGAVIVPERLGVQQLGASLSSLLGDPVLLSCLAVALIVRGTERTLRPEAQRLSLAAVAVAVVLGVLPAVYRDSVSETRGDPWNQVQEWVSQNTPKDAILLTPPHRDGFRVSSERAIVGEWKDGTQQFFSASFGEAWYARMQELKGATPAYDSFGAERLLELARRYQASHIVVSSASALPLSKVYENEAFAVYLVPRSG